MVLGRIVVDDRVDGFDVQAAGGHVGGHQDGKLAVGEVRQRPLAVGLAEVAVDGRGVARPPCRASRPAGRHPAWCARRRASSPGDRQMAAATLTLSIWCTCKEAVLHERRRSGWTRPPRGRPGRSGSAGPGGRRRRRAWPRTAASGAACSRRRSTHSTWGMKPMSAMRSASSSTRVSRSATDELAPVAEVDEPARRGDDHVDALAQLGHLAVDVGTAVDGDGPRARASWPAGPRTSCTWTASSRVGSRTRARGGPGGRPRLGPAPRARLGPLQERHAEGEGLARAGLGLAADVAAGQGVGDGQGLNWKSADDPFIGQRFGQFWETPRDSKVRAVS